MLDVNYLEIKLTEPKNRKKQSNINIKKYALSQL